MVFPLPLVAFEDYMLADDRPAFPMTLFVRLRFGGELDRRAFTAALTATVALHPLQASVVCRGRWGRHFWQPKQGEPALLFSDGPLADGYPSAPHINLAESTGLVAGVTSDGARSEVALQFHHASSDGLGAFGFVHDLLLQYAGRTGDRSAECPPRDVGALRHRGTFHRRAKETESVPGHESGETPQIAPWRLAGLYGVRQFLMRRPEPIVPHEALPNLPVPPSEFPATVFASLGETESSQLRRWAGENGVTTNDVLLRDLFLTLVQWRAGRELEDPHPWLRISVPVNLRHPQQSRMPAANVVSMVFLDRRGLDCANPMKLLRGVHDEVQLIKDLGLARAFLRSLKTVGSVPGAMKLMTRSEKCHATCVLTNVGEPLADVPLPRSGGKIMAGNVMLDEVDMLAPVRPYTSVAIGVVRYAGRLRFAMHYDPRPLSEADASGLMKTYLDQVRCSAAGFGDVAPISAVAAFAAT